MQFLLAGLVFGVDARFAPPSFVGELVPDVHGWKSYRRHFTPTFFKSHHLPQPEYRRVIYLVRDGRDVMVSYFHFLTALGQCQDFLTLVKEPEVWPSRWQDHIEAWMSNPYRAQLITVRYERLIEDTVGELRKICDFAGLECAPTRLESIAQNCTFEHMREQHEMWKSQAWRYGLRSPSFPRDHAFVRRGTVGSFKDEMPPEVLEEFLKLAMPMLKRLGYSKDELTL